MSSRFSFSFLFAALLADLAALLCLFRLCFWASVKVDQGAWAGVLSLGIGGSEGRFSFLLPLSRPVSRRIRRVGLGGRVSGLGGRDGQLIRVQLLRSRDLLALLQTQIFFLPNRILSTGGGPGFEGGPRSSGAVGPRPNRLALRLATFKHPILERLLEKL